MNPSGQGGGVRHSGAMPNDDNVAMADSDKHNVVIICAQFLNICIFYPGQYSRRCKYCPGFVYLDIDIQSYTGSRIIINGICDISGLHGKVAEIIIYNGVVVGTGSYIVVELPFGGFMSALIGGSPSRNG